MVKIFVSRILKADSPFYKDLPEAQYQVFGLSLIDFKGVEINEVPESDWLFFYSKNAVRYALKNERLNKAIHQRKLATMGKGTASVLQENGINPNFVGSSKPKKTAERLSTVINEESILFLRANNSRQSIQEFLPRNISVDDLVIYENNPKTEFEIPTTDILVFTSPVNAQTYFGKYPLLSSQKVLAIGYTTAKALSNLGIPKVYIAKEPSEKALVELILNTFPKN